MSLERASPERLSANDDEPQGQTPADISGCQSFFKFGIITKVDN